MINDLEHKDYNTKKETNQTTEDSVQVPFNPKEINFDTRVLSIYSVLKRLTSEWPTIILHPEFQRHEVWNKVKQSRLIESILLRFPLPAFYFDGSHEGAWEVIDGLQRLSTIRDFVINKTLRLQELEYLTHLNNKTFDELSGTFQRRIEETPITAFIIEEGTPPEVKLNIFKRINTWGVPLSTQEIRHALSPRESAKFIAEMAEIESFKIATGGIRKKRMLDRDFVTRFVAFYLTSYKEYRPDLDTFLANGMVKIQELDERQKTKLKSDFDNAMKIAYAIFGDDAFRKIKNKEGRKSPINKSLFEALAVNLAQLSENEQKLFFEKKNIVQEEFIELMQNDKFFIEAISSGTDAKRKVEKRFSTMENFIKKILEND